MELNQAGQQLYNAARRGDVAQVRALCLEWKGKDDVLNWRANVGMGSGWTPLLASCSSDSIECVRVLVGTRGVDVNRGDRELFCTPLLVSVLFGLPEIVCVLLAVPGLDEDLCCGFDSHVALNSVLKQYNLENVTSLPGGGRAILKIAQAKALKDNDVRSAEVARLLAEGDAHPQIKCEKAWMRRWPIMSVVYGCGFRRTQPDHSLAAELEKERIAALLQLFSSTTARDSPRRHRQQVTPNEYHQHQLARILSSDRLLRLVVSYL